MVINKLNFHNHGPKGIKGPFFHGYYSVNAEPTETVYKIDNEEIINVNKNGIVSNNKKKYKK